MEKFIDILIFIISLAMIGCMLFTITLIIVGFDGSFSREKLSNITPYVLMSVGAIIFITGFFVLAYSKN